MKHLGLGVMINSLGGNERTVKTLKSALNKIIEKTWIDENCLNIRFTDNSGIKIWDGGQSCCEDRYMRTDDNLEEFTGSKLLDMELKDAPDQEDEYGEVHEIQFLDVKTDKGVFQIANHNEHNGYYGGFWIEISEL